MIKVSQRHSIVLNISIFCVQMYRYLPLYSSSQRFIYRVIVIYIPGCTCSFQRHAVVLSKTACMSAEAEIQLTIVLITDNHNNTTIWQQSPINVHGSEVSLCLSSLAGSLPN